MFAYPCTRDFIYYFSRILYTESFEFQMYFLSENMFFFEIMQDIDIIPEKYDAVDEPFSMHRDIRKNGKKT